MGLGCLRHFIEHITLIEQFKAKGKAHMCHSMVIATPSSFVPSMDMKWSHKRVRTNRIDALTIHTACNAMPRYIDRYTNTQQFFVVLHNIGIRFVRILPPTHEQNLHIHTHTHTSLAYKRHKTSALIHSSSFREMNAFAF